MSRASTPTLLALDRYAKILGIAPPHFNQGVGTDIFPITNACSDVWPQYSWQNADQVSREELAGHIYDAEEDIARILGYYPAPQWIAQEVRQYPRHYRPDLYTMGGLNARGFHKSVPLQFGKFIQGGQRAVTANVPPTAVPVYDFAALTATISVATTFDDVCEVKAYFAGHSGDPEWEIRPAKSKSISLGTLTMVFDSWQLIDPDLWEAYPTPAGFSAIDIEAVGNHVTSIELYREFNDFTANSCTFFWEPRPRIASTVTTCTSCTGAGCVACSLSTQDGCISVRDTDMGTVVPQPATYSASDGSWGQDAFTICRDPDFVRLYYYAGDLDNRWRSGATCEPLSDFWAHPIAWIATARLERPFCSCGNVQALAERWRIDLAHIGETSFQFDVADLANPLGTRIGEVMAWKRIERIQGRQFKGGAA